MNLEVAGIRASRDRFRRPVTQQIDVTQTGSLPNAPPPDEARPTASPASGGIVRQAARIATSLHGLPQFLFNHEGAEDTKGQENASWLYDAELDGR
jgi:hypothetical protein